MGNNLSFYEAHRPSIQAAGCTPLLQGALPYPADRDHTGGFQLCQSTGEQDRLDLPQKGRE